MKVHFFGSLSGNTMKIGDKTHYERIVGVIEGLGHGVMTRHYLTKKVEDVLKEPDEKHKEYVRKMTGWVKKADVVVVEVTKPEIGTGYELSLAVNSGKPVIALYTDAQNSPILGVHDPDKIQHIEYDINNLKRMLREALETAKEKMDVRFNFFVSPKIVHYLDWIAKKRKMPRAVYLRRLIEGDMRKNKEYLREA